MTTTQNSASESPIGTAVALARLEVSYGMTRLGAHRVLAGARMNGSTETAAARVTFETYYPESFTVTGHEMSKCQDSGQMVLNPVSSQCGHLTAWCGCCGRNTFVVVRPGDTNEIPHYAEH